MKINEESRSFRLYREIGKRIVELLQKNYSVKAGFHKVNPDKMWSSVEYSQFDIHDRKRLTFLSKSVTLL